MSGQKYECVCPRCSRRMESDVTSRIVVHGVSKHGVAFDYPEDAITFKCCEEFDVPVRQCRKCER